MSNTKVMLTDLEHLGALKDALNQLGDKTIRIILSEIGNDGDRDVFSLPEMLEDDGSAYPKQIPDFNAFEDVAILPFSSGTTGKYYS